jgi:drug/metabolite transporter (DMT)-like permease
LEKQYGNFPPIIVIKLYFTELLFSIFFGFVFFRQIPGFEMLIGAILIIVGAIISSSRAVSTRTV